MSGAPGKRSAGVLLHPSSLPSGRLDDDARRWLDWLSSAGMHVWQMLPLGVPLAGVSPYQCASAFALNPQLFPPKLRKVLGTNKAFNAWYQRQCHWLDDYALFMALKWEFDGTPWMDWPAPLRQRNPEAIQSATLLHHGRIKACLMQQYQLYAYWQSLRSYAKEKQVALFGDMPIFVAHDSADVWAHPEYFLLDENGQPTLVAGVPPDYFSETGQRWGNPQYNWDYMAQTDFVWWRERLRYHFEFFDMVRIDHFRGLAASWMIPASCPTAVDGYWESVPGAALLQRIYEDMGEVPLVAEDLGLITPDVEALRLQFNLPGMSVLQFGFDAFEDNPHKPQNVTGDRVYYTGTHDNDTLKGWFASLSPDEQTMVLSTLNIPESPELINAMIEIVLKSAATLAMIPLQDLLGLGSEARMNTPGTTQNNWLWRLAWADIPDNMAASLHQQLQQSERL